MIKIIIDGKEIQVEEGTTVFKAASLAGIHIPHFCYHPAFPPEGTCRMCLIEIEGVPKLEMACATQVREGMKISTQSESVREGRRGVLEFLLAEHPLDCPICDKAGDCKLQDYYEEYGFFESQFSENKDRRDKKVALGKNLIHDQERCVLCRRCVRFLCDITKSEDIGIFERGGHTEVNIYLEKGVENNYSGNLAQLCPVGAITDTDFRFKTRSWFLETGETICPLCSRGCSIFVEFHTGFSRFKLPQRVYRIKARENLAINGHWICDLGRYGYGYLDQDRAEKLIGKNGDPVLNWDTGLIFLAQEIKRLVYQKKTSDISVLLNTGLTNEELFLIKKIFIDDLQVKNIFFVDPSSDKADEFLMTAERTPNKRGATEIGFELKSVDKDILENSTEMIVIFGHHFSDMFDLTDIKAIFDNISTKFLFTARKTDLDELVDMVFPVAYIAEKSGSLTNIDGIVQNFKEAMSSPGNSFAEWQALVELGKELALNLEYYKQLTSPEDIYQEMRKEIPFFEK